MPDALILADSTGALAHYERMSSELALCVEIDEAAKIKDAAAKLAAYARIRDDVENGVRFAELRERAAIKCGEISREVPKAEREGPRGEFRLPIDGKSKKQALNDAGLTTSTAARYEELGRWSRTCGSEAIPGSGRGASR